MRELLEAVVSEGSGKKASVEGYRIGGKTGTAQKYAGGAIAQGKYVSSFVGFAPADKPKYAVLMTVDEPSAGAYYGSVVAAPYVGEIFERVFSYESTPKLPGIAEEKAILPWMDGKDLAEAVRELEKQGYSCEIDGDGTKVKSTLPVGGSEVNKGDVILIYA
jgi:stage V sporulation protein D (sporulation-specific penicillin-binding protein)